ncbi:MAG: LysR family transcriptional regulator [Rhodocyclales bacterium]|nr:LysR family transcriptional regulator [Rhodocyclales bacterium]
MMTLSQLRTFQTVARLNSFSRAAEELHLTQPAVSAQIVALENTLKIRLFERMGRKIALTEPGRVALSCAVDIHLRVSQMQRELEDLGELNTGSLHIGASLVVGVYLLPEILARFKEKYPRVELVVRVDPARHILDMILRNELDLGIIGEGAPVTDERIVLKPILRDELVFIVPANHPLAEAGSISRSELAKMPFVLPAKDTASSESILEQISAEGITLHSVLELGNVGAVKRAVEAGLGVSIVSRYAVLRELQDGRLKCLRVSGVKLERQLSLCWHHGKPFSRLTTAFIHFIQEHMNGLP